MWAYYASILGDVKADTIHGTNFRAVNAVAFPDCVVFDVLYVVDVDVC